MKRLCLVILLAASPALAEGDVGDGLSLMDQGARLLLRGLIDEVEPQLRDLAEGLAPAWQKLGDVISNLDAYHAPEVQPNGDIIIRRKVPLIPDQGVGPGRRCVG